ncbi:hypothetical protein [Pseudomonas sp. NPDC089758]|uniref:hypothetical protein n=1 Tax=Pseudomonas sp. NPDC089758 TaxID=3364473 RepID=UPI00380A69ED
MSSEGKDYPLDCSEEKTLQEKLDEALSLPFAEKLIAINALATEGLHGDISLDAPDWLVDGTNFHTAFWSCNFGTAHGKEVRKFVNFDIELADGSSLIDPKNEEVWRWIRTYLAVQINPRFNEGSRKSGLYELLRFTKSLHSIDYVLLNDAELFDIGRLGLGMVSLSAITSFLTKSAATPVSDYLYEYPTRLVRWFRNKISEVTDADIATAVARFPLIPKIPSVEDRILGFSDEELIKVRTVIALNGWYDSTPGGRRFNPQPFVISEYRNTLHGVFLKPRSIEELNLDEFMAREFPGVPVTNERADGISLHHLGAI